jgi:hypothetical protein
MSDEIAAWAVTDDPAKLASLLEGWDAGRLPLEDQAHPRPRARPGQGPAGLDFHL